MDWVGVSRTIDHAVYTFLNAIAVILWRIDSAIIAMSLFSYNTQDWLTNRHNGGVWQVMEIITGPSGILGLKVWQIMLTLAIMLYGISRVARPFIRINAVDLGRMFMFAVFSFVVISSGSAMMIGVEEWRSDLGSYMYQEMSRSGSVNIDLPGVTPSNEPLYAPGDLDGRAPIRGWEAVSTSYFLVQSERELNHNIPPEDFRIAYCLYDPNEPIEEQTATNAQGCSPKVAWDEWDLVSTGTITEVWGISLPVEVSLSLPIVQEHPENRELAIRQAQAGVARLALGPVVALYPMIEANISLMLALSAAIIYLTLPIVLLFGFFLFTESMATRLLMRFITIMINTVILNGLIALFLLVLINVSVNGSLSAYLGLVGVAVIGGIMLARVAAGTLRETLSMALSTVGGIWMGATTTVMGKEAAKPARAALGVAKLAGTAAVAGAAGAKALDLWEAGRQSFRSGVRDVEQASPETVDFARRRAGQLPAPLARMARQGLDTSTVGEADPERVRAVAPIGGSSSASRAAAGPGYRSRPANGSTRLAAGAGLAAASSYSSGQNGRGGHDGRSASQQNGRAGVQAAASAPAQAGSSAPVQGEVVDRYSQEERLAVWRAGRRAAAQGRAVSQGGQVNTGRLQATMDQLDEQVARAFRGEQGQRDLAALIAAQQVSPRARGWGAPEGRRGRVDSWVGEAYRGTTGRGRGTQRVAEAGQGLFGEELAGEAQQVLARRDRAEVEGALSAARQAATQMPPEKMLRADGSLTGEGLRAVRARLDQQLEQRFQGRRGQQDLAALTAMALQPEVTASPEAFRRTAAMAPGGEGERAPGRVVPRELGLDPVAAGAYFSGLNRFARLSEQAGLDEGQRQQLLDEVKQQGRISAELRGQIGAALERQEARGQGTGLTVEEVAASARALPDTLSGPKQIRLAGQQAPEEGAPSGGVAAELRGQAAGTATSQPLSQTRAQPAASAVADGSGNETFSSRATPAGRASGPPETATPVDTGQLGAVVAAGVGAAAASMAAEVRERLAEQQAAGAGAPSAGVAAELRGQAVETATSQPPQPQQVVEQTSGGEVGGGEQAPRPAIGKYETTPQVEAPAAAVRDEDGAGEAALGGRLAASLGAARIGEPPLRAPGEGDADEPAGLVEELRRDLRDAEERSADAAEAPDLRAEALKQMAEEARAAAEKEEPSESRPAAREEQPPAESAASRDEQPAGPMVAGGGAGEAAILTGTEARPDPAAEAKQIAAELRSQVKAKDAPDEPEKETAISEPGVAARQGKEETDEGRPEGRGQKTGKPEGGAEARAKLMQHGQRRVDEAGAGGGGLVAELRRGRVDEKEEAVGAKKKKERGETVADTLSDKKGSEEESPAGSTPAGSMDDPVTAGARVVSLLPHHRLDTAAESSQAREKDKGVAKVEPLSGQEPAAKEPAATNPAGATESGQAKGKEKDAAKVEPRSGQESAPAKPGGAREKDMPGAKVEPLSGRKSPTAEPAGAQPGATDAAPRGRVAGRGPVPDSFVGGGARSASTKKKRRAARPAIPRDSKQSKSPSSSNDSPPGERGPAEKRPPLKR